MPEHDEMRELLAPAAAGTLDLSEQQRLEQHLRVCASCAAELEQWRELTAALRRLPTPQASEALVERVRIRAERELAMEAERHSHRGVLAFLVLVSWTVTLASWLLLRLLGGGLPAPLTAGLGWLGLPASQGWIWLTSYTVVSCVTAAVAAVLLGLRYRSARRTV